MPQRVTVIHRVCMAIEVLVQRERVGVDALEGVHRPETAGAGVHIPGTQIVEAQVRIELLTAVEINSLGRAVAGNHTSIGVIGERVDEVPIPIGQRPCGTMSIVDEVVNRPAWNLALADQVQPVVVNPLQTRSPPPTASCSSSTWA